MLSYTQNGVKGRRSGREKTRKKLKYDGTYLCMNMSVVSFPFLFGHAKGTYFLSIYFAWQKKDTAIQSH